MEKVKARLTGCLHDRLRQHQCTKVGCGNVVVYRSGGDIRTTSEGVTKQIRDYFNSLPKLAEVSEAGFLCRECNKEKLRKRKRDAEAKVNEAQEAFNAAKAKRERDEDALDRAKHNLWQSKVGEERAKTVLEKAKADLLQDSD